MVLRNLRIAGFAGLAALAGSASLSIAQTPLSQAADEAEQVAVIKLRDGDVTFGVHRQFRELRTAFSRSQLQRCRYR